MRPRVFRVRDQAAYRPERDLQMGEVDHLWETVETTETETETPDFARTLANSSHLSTCGWRPAREYLWVTPVATKRLQFATGSPHDWIGRVPARRRNPLHPLPARWDRHRGSLSCGRPRRNRRGRSRGQNRSCRAFPPQPCRDVHLTMRCVLNVRTARAYPVKPL